MHLEGEATEKGKKKRTGWRRENLDEAQGLCFFIASCCVPSRRKACFFLYDERFPGGLQGTG
jgi:hypothetical protein